MSTLRPDTVDSTARIAISDEEDTVVARTASFVQLPELSLREKGEEGDLELGEEIGAGGMGAVLSARQHSLGRDVAVKRIHSEHKGTHSNALLNEARLTGQLEHPGVIPVYALGTVEGGRQPLMVMKRLDGAVWSDLIHDDKDSKGAGFSKNHIDRHIRILIRVCEVLEFAHSRRIVHRDVKPENVMIGDFGEVYLVDWGVALRLDEKKFEDQNLVVGTPAYIAPEMVCGPLAVTEKSDVFLLGATLHEVLTGLPRHKGEHTIEVLRTANVCEPFNYGPEVPYELAVLCRNACAREPSERIPTARAFRLALENFTRHHSSQKLVAKSAKRLSMLEDLSLRAGEPTQEEGLRATALYSQVRFGFEEVMQGWPDNIHAAEGLKRAHRAMLEVELARKNPAGARTLLAELPDSHWTLKHRLDKIESEREAQSKALTRLKEVEKELRFSSSSWTQSTLFVVHGIFWFGAMLAIIIANDQGILQINSQVNAAFGGAVVLGGGIVVLIFRRVLLDNQVRRRFAIAVLIFNTAFLLNRLLALGADLTVYQTANGDYVLACSFIALMSVYISPIFWFSFVVVVIGAFLTTTNNEMLLPTTAIIALLVNLTAAYILRPEWSGWSGRSKRSG